MSEENLETKYCGEVIGDEVQLWAVEQKQMTWGKLNVTGEKTWQEINLEPENKTKQNVNMTHSKKYRKFIYSSRL